MVCDAFRQHLSYHEIWISGTEMNKGRRDQNSVPVKNHDILVGQEPLSSHWTQELRSVLSSNFIHRLLHHPTDGHLIALGRSFHFQTSP